MIGNPSASTWTRSRYGFASALSCSTARCCSDSCLRTALAGAAAPFIFPGRKPKACQGRPATLHRLATAQPGRRRGRRDDAHASSPRHTRVRYSTAPCCETQRLDSDVSSPPTSRSRRSPERPTAEVNMKLKAVQSLPSIKLAGRVPGDLHVELIAYAEYYREPLGEPDRPLAARGSVAPHLHAPRLRVPGVESRAPQLRGGGEP